MRVSDKHNFSEKIEIFPKVRDFTLSAIWNTNETDKRDHKNITSI